MRAFKKGDLSSNNLLQILDVLVEADGEPLTVGQIQHRLGYDRTYNEIEAHLRWGRAHPEATNALVRASLVYHTNTWVAVAKHPPMTREQLESTRPSIEVHLPSISEEHIRKMAREDKDFSEVLDWVERQVGYDRKARDWTRRIYNDEKIKRAGGMRQGKVGRRPQAGEQGER